VNGGWILGEHETGHLQQIRMNPMVEYKPAPRIAFERQIPLSSLIYKKKNELTFMANFAQYKEI